MAKQSSGKESQKGAAGKSQPASAARRREQQRLPAQRNQPQQHNRRKVQRKSNTGLWATLGVVVVAILVVIGIFIYLATRPSSSTATNGSGYPSTPADPTVMQQITGISSSAFAAVGTGPTGVVSKPTKLNFTTLLTGPNGKPEVFYQGGEYCPYCAAERWAMVVALSRFGTFHNLSQISSSSTDVYANTPTFSFYKSTYTSQYIDFVPLEQQSYQGTTLQNPTSAEQQIISSFNPGGSFPFIDIGNKYSITGASYDPKVLANLDWQGISSSLSNPNNPVAQSILGAANYLTAAICESTGQQPASICKAAPIPAVEAALNSSSGSTGSQGLAISAPVAALWRMNG